MASYISGAILVLRFSLQPLPVGGLLVFDLGFFKFLWFDQFNEQQHYFLTRLPEKTAYRVGRTLSQEPRLAE